jgi:hypothetical protein
MNITVHDKLACVVREVHYRRRVYPRLIASRKMSQSMADREIAVMESIVNDYKASAKVVDPPEPELQFTDDE